jgi:hypothetical protein
MKVTKRRRSDGSKKFPEDVVGTTVGTEDPVGAGPGDVVVDDPFGAGDDPGNGDPETGDPGDPGDPVDEDPGDPETGDTGEVIIGPTDDDDETAGLGFKVT